MRTVYRMYQVEAVRHNANSLSIYATNRKEKMFTIHLKRDKDNYFEGYSDFGFSSKKTFKGIVLEFFITLLKEAREYDKDWYDFHCLQRMESSGKTRSLLWEEVSKQPKPDFKGSVTFKTERYE